YGLSMVTLCYLRRYLHLIVDVLRDGPATSFDVSRELVRLFEGVGGVLRDHAALLDGPVRAVDRKSFMDSMGSVNDRYRAEVYEGFCGKKAPLEKRDLLEFAGLALEFLDHSIGLGRRDDGLFDAYNLVRFGAEGYEVESLDEMLEGQVAVLSSGYLDGEAALALLEALKASRLYREDQNSYMLYPDRNLPSFLEKNVIPPSLVKDDDWIKGELEAGRTDYVERDVDGRMHFNGAFRNADQLRAALERDPSTSAEDVGKLCDLYEAVFAHRQFTGRSGSMYKYEGLGCIYWHMVSKLLLAVQENFFAALEQEADETVCSRLGQLYYRIREGMGFNKTPAEYGAFPTDPYSHTPKHGGAQQPGMTGQVKEEVLSRFGELGVRVTGGEVRFDPRLLRECEFAAQCRVLRFLDVDGEWQELTVPERGLAFTWCQVPVIYRLTDDPVPAVTLIRTGGDTRTFPQLSLPGDLSAELFDRNGRVCRIEASFPTSFLLSLDSKVTGN
ncbi:MAG: hypothetical protein OEU49_08660, partial [Chromatiales bacterium]|nr:hypothetical protein [Chromatiales bacterium]